LSFRPGKLPPALTGRRCRERDLKPTDEEISSVSYTWKSVIKGVLKSSTNPTFLKKIP
jgi:hypothetical protein